jgi:hypothetical protein
MRPIRERLEQVERILIRHSRFMKICKEIDYCATYTATARAAAGASSGVSTREPPCLTILGATGTGKTTLVETWIRDTLRREPPPKGELPYLFVLLDPGIRLKGAAEIILRALGDPNADRGTLGNMQERVYHLMKELKVRMFFVDEFQQIVDRQTWRVVQDVADFFKTIVKKTGVPLVLIGTDREVKRVLEDDGNSQLARLVGTPQLMQPFAWDRERERETIAPFCVLLEAIDRALPFAPADLGAEDMAYRFHYASDGRLGLIMEIIRRAAWEAIMENAETIAMDHLRHAYDARIAGTPFGFVDADDITDLHAHRRKRLPGGRESIAPHDDIVQRIPRENPFTQKFAGEQTSVRR